MKSATHLSAILSNVGGCIGAGPLAATLRGSPLLLPPALGEAAFFLSGFFNGCF